MASPSQGEECSSDTPPASFLCALSPEVSEIYCHSERKGCDERAQEFAQQPPQLFLPKAVAEAADPLVKQEEVIRQEVSDRQEASPETRVGDILYFLEWWLRSPEASTLREADGQVPITAALAACEELRHLSGNDPLAVVGAVLTCPGGQIVCGGPGDGQDLRGKCELASLPSPLGVRLRGLLERVLCHVEASVAASSSGKLGFFRLASTGAFAVSLGSRRGFCIKAEDPAGGCREFQAGCGGGYGRCLARNGCCPWAWVVL